MTAISRFCSLLALCVASSAVFVCGSIAAPKPVDKPSKFAGYFANRSRLSERVVGLFMHIEVASDPEPTLKSTQVNWKFDYNGKRPPCIVLEPSMQRHTSGQTRILVYAEGKGGLRETRLESPAYKGAYASQPSWFVTIPDGKMASGKFTFDLTQAKADLMKRWPKDFDDQEAPPLHIQVNHKPFDRGGGHNLDAWTGDLYSPVLKVALKKW